MNSRIFLVLALVVVGGGIFAYSYVQQDMTTPSVGENTGSPSSSQAAVEAVVSTETEVSGDAYRISDESLVRYHAQKRWLKKPTEVVDATNTDVSGTVYFDTEQSSLTGLVVTIDSQSFVSGSGMRDADVKKMFSENITIRLSESIAVTDTASFNGSVELDVMINGVTKRVPFTTTASVVDGVITAKGEGSIMLGDFGIDAPSVLNLYTVDEKLGVSFDISARQSS